jgi:4-hydroxy-tetrahydrodipicolinate reductase
MTTLALLGYGKMGRAIHALALAEPQQFSVTAIIDPLAKEATAREITPKNLNGAKVAIDFTAPTAVLNNLRKIADAKINLVIGTTGWYDQLDTVRQIATDAKIGALYASNFSLGVQAFFRIVRSAAQIINGLENYDVLARELHHAQKLDSPSGTALSLGEILLEEIKRKKKLATEKLDRAPAPDEVHLSSTRGGKIPGTHEIIFDSEADTITLTHTARTRDGFALGALRAAQWLENKKGIYTAEGWIRDMLGF